MKRNNLLVAGLLLCAAFAATINCVSGRAVARAIEESNPTIADSAPIQMPEVVVTAERPAPETGVAMMPEIVVTARRPDQIPAASVWTGDAPKAALAPFGVELRRNAE